VFEPGSGTLDASAADVLDSIAIMIADCPDLQLEIQGYTDSQGRESMNQALSQTRAQSVLTALQDRRILTKGFVAVGYGESKPIADNETQEGRDANRRIEFVQVMPETEEQTEGDAEADAETDASDTATSEPETADTSDAQAQSTPETDGEAVDTEAQAADTDSEADADNAETADPDAAGEETTNDQN
jgi:OOP family OmpA-OmpF porin